MVGPKKRDLLNQISTVLIVIAAMIVCNVAPLSQLLVYERRAVLGGELWRLFSAPLVHFTVGHLFWDSVVFAAAGCAIHGSGFRGFWWVCGIGTVSSSILFLLFFPHLERFGGLSGPATGAVVYLCLCCAYRSKKNRMIWLSILS